MESFNPSGLNFNFSICTVVFALVVRIARRSTAVNVPILLIVYHSGCGGRGEHMHTGNLVLEFT